jgi:hypothetical protein
VSLAGGDGGNPLYGYVPGNKTLPPISNGRVNIPLYKLNANGTLERYSGSDTCDLIISIHGSSSGDPNSVLEMGYIESVKFSNGNATRSWSDGSWSGGW